MIPDGFHDRTTPRYMSGMFGDWPQGGASGSAELALKQAHGRTRDAWAAVFKRSGRLKGDPTMTEAARVLKAAEFAREQTAAVNATRNDALARLQERREEIAEHFRRALAPPTSAGDVALNAEIRTYLKSLTLEERSRWVNANFTKDESLRRAIATGPPFLSGLTDHMHARVVDTHLSIVKTEEWSEATRLDAAEGRLNHATSAYHEHINHQINFVAADEIAKQIAGPEYAAA